MKTHALIKVIVEAAYEWRVAKIHAELCVLGVREDDNAEQDVEDKLTNLRIQLDRHKTTVDCCFRRDEYLENI